MRSNEEFDHVLALIDAGMNDCEVARSTGIPRRTIMDWRHKSAEGWRPGLSGGRVWDCPICSGTEFNSGTYAYLLGLYLGDGYLASMPRRVYRLRIALDQAYPNIIDECIGAINAIKISGKPAARVTREGCDEICSYWKHWICLFPQHGPGPKHSRNIALEPWQQEIVDRFPNSLIRGLIHSDGCRYLNRVGIGYQYVSYDFTNHSSQIQSIFTNACDRLEIRWRRSSWKVIAITRRPDVAKMEAIVGPKT